MTENIQNSFSELPDSAKDSAVWTFVPNVLYEFTINGNDNSQCATSLEQRYARNRKLLREILKDAPFKYWLQPEITMPQYGRRATNEYPRIHWHGVVMFPTYKSVVDYLTTTAVSLARYGSYQYNEFRPEWIDYMDKHRQWFIHLPGNYELKNTYEFEKLWKHSTSESSD